MQLRWLPSLEPFTIESSGIYPGTIVQVRTHSGANLGVWTVVEVNYPENCCRMVDNEGKGYDWWAEGLEPLFPEPKYSPEEIVARFSR